MLLEEGVQVLVKELEVGLVADTSGHFDVEVGMLLLGEVVGVAVHGEGEDAVVRGEELSVPISCDFLFSYIC